jgi:transposase
MLAAKEPKIGQRLLRQARLMLHWWHKIRDGTLDRAAFQRQMKPVRKKILALLRRAQVCPRKRTAGMAKKILSLQDALFTFVDHEGVEPTNNVAERQIRAGVLWRKVSFGTHAVAEIGEHALERALNGRAYLSVL